MRPVIKRVAARRGFWRRVGRTDLLVWGATIHLAIDWLTQNEWIALHKHQVVHPAGYLHAGVHGAAQWLVFPAPYAAALGLAHQLIDTRQPLRLWEKIISEPENGATAVSVRIARDQTAHLVSIAVAALLANPRD